MLLRRIARPLLSAAFIGQGIEGLLSPKPAADAARPTLETLQKLPEPVGPNVPSNAETFAKITAAVQIGGGVLLATGKVPRLASVALAATVIPANLGSHMFWSEIDPERKAQKRREFLTDVSLIGGLIIASADTAGKPSLGWRGKRAARHLTEAVSAALPVGAAASHSVLDSDLGERVADGLHAGAERGREIATVAAERGAPLLEAARHRGAELAEVARERGAEFAEVASKRSAEYADLARERGAELAEVASKRGAVLADVASKRSADFADVASKRSAELASDWADVARDRGEDLVDAARGQGKVLAKSARKQAKAARKQASKQAKELRSR